VIAYLILQGAVFALWSVVAFRCLFRLAGRVRQETGLALPGPSGLGLALRLFLHDPAFRTDRRRLGVLTPLLLALSAMAVLVLPGPGG
jgi:hypothetical protein